MEEDLFDLVALQVNSFDLNRIKIYLFRSYVLTLLKLEDILLAID